LKITIIGKSNHLYWLENVVETFNSLKYTTQKIAVNHLGIIGDTNRNLLKIFNEKLASSYNANLIEKKLGEFNPDVIMVISPFLLNSAISDVIGSMNNKIHKIAWIGDRFTNTHKNIANNYDLLYCTDSYFIEEAKEFNFPEAKYLPLAVNKKIFYNKNLDKKDKLLFIGSPTKDRIDLFNTISCDLKLIGKKWKSSITQSNIEIFNKNISINKVASEYNKYKFILNVKHEHNVINGLNMRSFEAPAVGCCLIQDNVKDLGYNFDIDNEIIVYNNIDEVSEIVSKLIIDKNRTLQIINNAQKCIESKHTYSHRLNTILNYLK